MIVTGSIDEVCRARADYATDHVGLVPTMGYLHEGHMSLARRARLENDLVVASIYVNPTQFAPNEDLDRYPRDLERDIALLSAEGVDVLFTPDDLTMYPDGFQTNVVVRHVTQTLEGATRPTHFAGVTTVVAKLFNIVQPTHAYFGQKDAQQSVVIRQMVADLNFPVEVVVCPTVRESDGLAMSSRNKYLNHAERTVAPILYATLLTIESMWRDNVRDADILRQAMEDALHEEPLAIVDYVSIANPRTLVEWNGTIPPNNGALVSLAVRFGQTRLIDNILVN